ncbi:MarR family winged helix-turn-helix transcriptional regulator [Thermogemmatispora sp.]|uniref:MarR family winged helix-turn-helix transcriptional regulator n=1 Tax=Thermogemmatispora sp. TaxID=1968838 RepID=UPI001D5AA801|nr:MarR family transcriptional regulator [Thermogemmatispora sp.]MBX5452097.1 MarR family transcriptional regulator [Thermogemmatispora sp.]
MRPDSLDDSAALAMELLDIVPKVLRQMHADALNSEVLAEPDREDLSEIRTTSGQLSLLRILIERKCCMMQELARQLGVTPSTVTAMVKRLQAQGYLERSRDEADWRTVWVKPTARAQRLVQLYDRGRLASLERRLARLSEAEREHLVAALPALRRLIEG